jgi:hypothetical protein
MLQLQHHISLHWFAARVAQRVCGCWVSSGWVHPDIEGLAGEVAR